MSAPFIATYVNFAPPDLSVLGWFGVALAALSMLLVLLRGLGRMRDRRLELRSAWKTFHRVAAARGFNRVQTHALSVAARAGGLRRPAQIMGSVLVLDRCVNRAHDLGELSAKETAVLAGVRERLLSTPEVRNAHEERRQLSRMDCAVSVDVVLVPREDLEQEMASRELDDLETVRRKLEEIAVNFAAVRARIVNLSAGGLALSVAADTLADKGGYCGIQVVHEQIPVDLKSVWGEVRSVSRPESEGDEVTLHLGFLPIPIEVKRQIIALVYAQTEGSGGRAAAKERQRRKPKSGAQGAKTVAKSAGERPRREIEDSDKGGGDETGHSS